MRTRAHTHTHTHTGDKYAVIIGQHGVNLSADAGLTWRPAPHNLNIADTSAVQDAYLSSATDARYPTAVLSSLETGALPLHTDVLLLDFALSSGRAHNTSASSGVVWKSAVVSIAGVVAVASQRGREGGRERERHTHVNFSISRTSVHSTHTHTCRCRPNCLIYVFNFFLCITVSTAALDGLPAVPVPVSVLSSSRHLPSCHSQSVHSHPSRHLLVSWLQCVSASQIFMILIY